MATTPATPPAVSPYTVTDGIAYSPTTDEGNGILPPFIRGAGHLICTLLVMSVEGQTLMTPEEARNEVAAASAHFNRITDEACRNISRTGKTAITS